MNYLRIYALTLVAALGAFSVPTAAVAINRDTDPVCSDAHAPAHMTIGILADNGGRVRRPADIQALSSVVSQDSQHTVVGWIALDGEANRWVNILPSHTAALAAFEPVTALRSVHNPWAFLLLGLPNVPPFPHGYAIRHCR